MSPRSRIDAVCMHSRVGFHSDTPLLACTRSFVPTCARCTERAAVTGEIERALPTVPSTMVQLQESYATGTTSRQPARPPFGTPPAAPTKPKRVWKQRANDSRGDANLFSLWSLRVSRSRDTRGERGERGVTRVRIYLPAARRVTATRQGVWSSATSRYRDSSLR